MAITADFSQTFIKEHQTLLRSFHSGVSVLGVFTSGQILGMRSFSLILIASVVFCLSSSYVLIDLQSRSHKALTLTVQTKKSVVRNTKEKTLGNGKKGYSGISIQFYFITFAKLIEFVKNFHRRRAYPLPSTPHAGPKQSEKIN